MELNANTNSIRVKLNRLEEVELLNSTLEVRRKPYRVNAIHHHVCYITSIMKQVAGIDTMINRLVNNLPELKDV